MDDILALLISIECKWFYEEYKKAKEANKPFYILIRGIKTEIPIKK